MAQESGVFGARAFSGWRASAQVVEAWDNNPRLTYANPRPDLVSRAELAGARLWQAPRTRIEFGAGGALVRYRATPELDRTAHDLSLQATRQLARRLGGTVELQSRSDLTGRSVTPSGEGPLLAGVASVRTRSAASTVTYRLARTVAVRAGGSYQNTSFDTPLLLGGWTSALDAQVSQRQTANRSVALEYEFRRAETRLFGSDAHRLTSTWNQRLGDRLGAELTLGALNSVQRVPRTQVGSAGIPLGDSARGRQAFSTLSGTGGGSLRLRRTRDHISAEYQRSVGPVFGDERPSLYTTDVVGMTYERAFRPRLTVSTAARYVLSTGVDRAQGRVRSTEGEATARYVTRTGFTVFATGLHSRRDGAFALRSNRVMLGFGRVWSQVRRTAVAASGGR